jgi:hypothetical protein
MSPTNNQLADLLVWNWKARVTGRSRAKTPMARKPAKTMVSALLAPFSGWA